MTIQSDPPTSTIAHGIQRIWSCAKPLDVHIEATNIYATMQDARFSYADNAFIVAAGGTVSFDCLMNLFCAIKTSTLTGLRNFILTIDYQGAGEVDVLSFHDGIVRSVASQRLPHCDSAQSTSIDLHFNKAPPEFIFVRFSADELSTLLDVSVNVLEAPRQKVYLAIVITAFNRSDEVEDQLRRLEALEGFGLSHRVFVIDNAQSFKPTRSYLRTTIIPSENWGGAGGFTRGLLAAMDEGHFTHVMFMDDDAVCHPAAIQRAAALLGYTEDNATAFTGAMNYCNKPGIQYEMGALVGAYGVQPIQNDVTVDGLAAISKNEAAPAPHYGAWWCFLFPISAVRTLPYPFFVRGDDIVFSLQNKFVLHKMPGLLAWHPSFEYKISAVVEYLVTRSFLMIPLLVDVDAFSKKGFISGIRKQLSVELCGLRYAIAEAMCAALEDVLTGPAFWLDVQNTTRRMAALRKRERELHGSVTITNAVERKPDRWEGHLLQFFYEFLGKFNLPIALCGRRAAACAVMYPMPQLAFLREGMIYGSPDNPHAMYCKRDPSVQSRIQARANSLVDRIERNFDDLSRAYRESAAELQSEAAWRSRFALAPTNVVHEHPSV